MYISAHYHLELRMFPTRPQGREVYNRQDLDGAMKLPAQIKIGGIEFSVQTLPSRVEVNGGVLTIIYPFKIKQLSEWPDMGRFLDGVRSRNKILPKLWSAMRRLAGTVPSDTAHGKTAFSLGAFISELQNKVGIYMLEFAADVAPKGITVNVSEPKLALTERSEFDVSVIIEADEAHGW